MAEPRQPQRDDTPPGMTVIDTSDDGSGTGGVFTERRPAPTEQENQP